METNAFHKIYFNIISIISKENITYVLMEFCKFLKELFAFFLKAEGKDRGLYFAEQVFLKKTSLFFKSHTV